MSCADLEKEESPIGKVGFLPHFGGCVQVFGPSRKKTSGSEDWNPLRTEVNIQELGLEFRAPSPLGQPRRRDFRCVEGLVLYILYQTRSL